METSAVMLKLIDVYGYAWKQQCGNSENIIPDHLKWAKTGTVTCLEFGEQEVENTTKSLWSQMVLNDNLK